MENFVLARGAMKWFLDRYNMLAITMPWGTVYCANEDWEDDVGMQTHEYVHLYQIRRDGSIWFTLRYLWWCLRYGYRNNPYETEAYSIENALMLEDAVVITGGEPRTAQELSEQLPASLP